MSSKKVNNPDKNRHPYLQPKKWADGTLCFWRNNSMYSEQTKNRLEEGVKRMIKEQVNPSKLMDKPL